jgi:hypothetical protein
MVDSDQEREKTRTTLAKSLNVAENDSRIKFRVRKKNQRMDAIREAFLKETGLRLSNIVLLWEEDPVFLGTEFFGKTFKSVAATIQHEFDLLVVTLLSA